MTLVEVQWLRAGDPAAYVDRILRDANPSDLPVQAPAAGGLMSYDGSLTDTFGQVGRILVAFSKVKSRPIFRSSRR